MSIKPGQREFAQAKTLVPLSTLKDEPLAALLESVDLEVLAAGGTVFRAGDTQQQHVYLLAGEVTLLAGDKPVERVRGGTDPARFPLGPQIPRKYSARAVTQSTLIRVDSRRLNDLLTTNHEVDYEVGELGDAGSDSDWMAQLLASRVMQRIPAANIQGVMRRIDRFDVPLGEQVVTQGKEGDFFYVISRGRAVVTRDIGAGRSPIEVATLGPGDCFGEEALLAGKPRNSNVVMLSDGVLMRLGRQDFVDLIRKPVARFQPFVAAQQRIEQGARWLDVRGPEEHAQGHLPDAINLPIELLREHCGSLHPDFHYVVYSDSNGRSAAAAFLLTERGYDVSVLENGLTAVAPDRLTAPEQPPTPLPAESPPEPPAKPASDAAPLGAPADAPRAAELAASRQFIEKARKRIAALEQERQQGAAELAQLQAQFESLRQESARAVAEAARLRADQERLLAERAVVEEQAQRDIELLTQRIGGLKAELDGLRGEVTAGAQARERYDAQQRESEAAAREQADRHAAAEQQLVDARVALDALRAERDQLVLELQGRLAEQRSARDALSEQLATATTRHAEALRGLEERLAAQAAEQARLTAQTADLAREREQANASAAAADAAAAQLRGELRALDARVDVLQTERDRLAGELSARQAEAAEAAQQLQSLLAATAADGERALRALGEEMASRATEAEQAIATLRGQLNAQAAEAARLGEALADATRRADGRAAEAERVAAALADALQRLEEQSAEAARLGGALAEAVQQRDQRDADAARLDGALRDAAAALDAMRVARDAALADAAARQDSERSLVAERDAALSQAADLKGERDTLADAVNSLRDKSRARSHELTERLKAAEARQQAVEATLAGEREQRAQEQRDLEARDALVARLQAELDAQVGDGGRLRESLETQSSRIAALEADISGVTTERDDLRSALAAQRAEIESRQEALAALAVELEALRAKARTLTDALAAAEASNSAGIAEREAHVADLEARLAAQRRDHETAAADLETHLAAERAAYAAERDAVAAQLAAAEQRGAETFAQLAAQAEAEKAQTLEEAQARVAAARLEVEQARRETAADLEARLTAEQTAHA
nr:cyclic nucleotide-binding domain-containing protein [Gammaproteobacteria bacterium]